MAQLKKVKRFLEIDMTKTKFVSLLENKKKEIIMTMKIKEGQGLDEKDIKEFNKAWEMAKETYPEVINASANFYAGLLSDEEIDELIDLYSRPIIARMHELQPEISKITSRIINKALLSKQ